MFKEKEAKIIKPEDLEKEKEKFAKLARERLKAGDLKEAANFFIKAGLTEDQVSVLIKGDRVMKEQDAERGVEEEQEKVLEKFIAELEGKEEEKEEPELSPEEEKAEKKTQKYVRKMYKGLLKAAKIAGDKEKINLYKAVLRDLKKSKKEEK